MSIKIWRHLELVFETYRMRSEEMKEQYKWLPSQCLCKEKLSTQSMTFILVVGR